MYTTSGFVDSFGPRYDASGPQLVAYRHKVSVGGSPHRRQSDVLVFQPASQTPLTPAPLTNADFERSDSWTESRDMTFSRILSAEEFLAVSYVVV